MAKISKSNRSALARKVGHALTERNLSPKAIAADAHCDVRTVRNFLNGQAVKDETVRQICKAANIDLEIVRNKKSVSRSADELHGSYSENLLRRYVGSFYAFRRSFSFPQNILRSVYRIEWDKKRDCLTFREVQKYPSTHLRRNVDYSQNGDIFISDMTSLLHLLTMVEGSVRLITLTPLHPQENFMRGAVLTQGEFAGHYEPAISAIYFRKIQTEVSLDELARDVMPIEPKDIDYKAINELLVQTENDVVRMIIDPQFYKPRSAV